MLQYVLLISLILFTIPYCSGNSYVIFDSVTPKLICVQKNHCDTIDIHGEGCATLKPNWKNRVRLINTHSTCVVLWDHEKCYGNSSILPPTDPVLILISIPKGSNGTWDRKVSSISTCAYSPEETTTTPATISGLDIVTHVSNFPPLSILTPIGVLLLMFLCIIIILWSKTQKRQVTELEFENTTLNNLPLTPREWNSCQPFAMSRIDSSLLGYGSFGSVYKVKHKVLNEEFALKKIPLSSSHVDENFQRDLREIRNLFAMNHANVVRMYHTWMEDTRGEINPEELPKAGTMPSSTPIYFLFIQMELCDFNLHTWIEQNPHLEDRRLEIPKLMKDCIHGVAALHAKHIIHRDIKPKNIFCVVSSEDGVPENWKIGDLGLSIQIEPGIEDGFQTMGIGTKEYMSPELYSGGVKGHSLKTDVFSLGLSFLEAIVHLPTPESKMQIFRRFRANLGGKSLLEMFNNSNILDSELELEVRLTDELIKVNPESRIELNSEEIRKYLTALELKCNN